MVAAIDGQSDGRAAIEIPHCPVADQAPKARRRFRSALRDCSARIPRGRKIGQNSTDATEKEQGHRQQQQQQQHATRCLLCRAGAASDRSSMLTSAICMILFFGFRRQAAVMPRQACGAHRKHVAWTDITRVGHSASGPRGRPSGMPAGHVARTKAKPRHQAGTGGSPGCRCGAALS